MPPRPAAAATLAVPPAADPAAARAAFLRRVAATGFVPPEDACAAVNALAETALPLSLSARADAAVAVREAIDEFARGYWDLAPAARAATRAALAAAGPAAADARFLDHLRAAESLAFDPPTAPRAGELAVLARDLYRMRPRQRAARRAEWLETRDPAADWAAAAADLKATAPDIARLDRPLFDVFTLRPQPAAQAPRRSTPLPPDPTEWADEAPARPVISSGAWWAIAAAVMIAGRAILALGSGSSSPAPRSFYTPPQRFPDPAPALFQNPAVGLPDTTAKPYTAEEIRRFRAYDPAAGTPEPPGYQVWSLLETVRRLEDAKKARRNAGVPDLPAGTRK